MYLEPGHTVGPYVVDALLGRGGMGAVYLARDVRLGRQVALKFLKPPGPLAGEDRRLLREARAASHPNICQVFDVGGDHVPVLECDGRMLVGNATSAQIAELLTGSAQPA